MTPDYRQIETVLHHVEEPSRVPLYEHFIDNEIIEAVMGYALDDPTLSEAENRQEHWRKVIRFYEQMGYDYLPLEFFPRFAQRDRLLSDDTAQYSRGRRDWVNEHGGPIKSTDDLENPSFWPDVDQLCDYAAFDEIGALLPPGMKIIGGIAGGPFEHATLLCGLEPLAYAIYEDEEFVTRLFRQIGERLLAGAARLVRLDCFGAYRFGDDLGYKTATMLSPSFLRQYVFPWYAKVCDVCHAAGKPFILHSCGDLSEVMDDIINTGIDAKHSFEDVIMPVTEVKTRWGEKIAILGGIDLHFLCTANTHEIKVYTKYTLDACARGGGYALGSGNTVANYVPVQNFLAMIDATKEWNGQK